MWATGRKNLPVKDVAAAGEWKDIMTPHGVLSAAGRGVAEISGGIPEAEPGISLFGGGASLASETRTQTHTGPQIGKAPPPGNPMRRFQLPLLGSNQDSPDPEPEPTGRRFRATCRVFNDLRASAARSVQAFCPLFIGETLAETLTLHAAPQVNATHQPT
jgi:hypothetical protein